MPTYAVRAPLARWLGEEARRAAPTSAPYRLLDVGCGEKPYAPSSRRIARDTSGRPGREPARRASIGPIEALPALDAAFDVVLCIQVLEHVDDPAQGVRELAPRDRAREAACSSRRTARWSTTRTPSTYWRWTHAASSGCSRENGDWAFG